MLRVSWPRASPAHLEQGRGPWLIIVGLAELWGLAVQDPSCSLRSREAAGFEGRGTKAIPRPDCIPERSDETDPLARGAAAARGDNRCGPRRGLSGCR